MIIRDLRPNLRNLVYINLIFLKLVTFFKLLKLKTFGKSGYIVVYHFTDGCLTETEAYFQDPGPYEDKSQFK